MCHPRKNSGSCAGWLHPAGIASPLCSCLVFHGCFWRTKTMGGGAIWRKAELSHRLSRWDAHLPSRLLPLSSQRPGLYPPPPERVGVAPFSPALSVVSSSFPQYRHSGPPYVGPPQQYPVQPPGPGPFYPGPGPGEFPNAYGKMFLSEIGCFWSLSPTPPLLHLSSLKGGGFHPRAPEGCLNGSWLGEG